MRLMNIPFKSVSDYRKNYKIWLLYSNSRNRLHYQFRLAVGSNAFSYKAKCSGFDSRQSLFFKMYLFQNEFHELLVIFLVLNQVYNIFSLVIYQIIRLKICRNSFILKKRLLLPVYQKVLNENLGSIKVWLKLIKI